LEYKIIINGSKLVHIPLVHHYHWNIVFLGKLEEINSIIVLENDVIRDTFYLKSDEDREIFKLMSFRVNE
jgi:hypothetical protein